MKRKPKPQVLKMLPEPLYDTETITLPKGARTISRKRWVKDKFGEIIGMYQTSRVVAKSGKRLSWADMIYTLEKKGKKSVRKSRTR